MDASMLVFLGATLLVLVCALVLVFVRKGGRGTPETSGAAYLSGWSRQGRIGRTSSESPLPRSNRRDRMGAEALPEDLEQVRARVAHALEAGRHEDRLGPGLHIPFAEQRRARRRSQPREPSYAHRQQRRRVGGPTKQHLPAPIPTHPY